MYIVFDTENEICSEPCNTIDECFDSIIEMGCLDKFGGTYKVINLETDCCESILLSFNKN